jgi:penicillin-binding protein 1B
MNKYVKALILGALATILVVVVVVEYKLSTLVLGGLGESFSTKVYSAPLVITEETPLAPADLLERLSRLEYKAVPATPTEPGTYEWNSPNLKLYLRQFHSPWIKQDAMLVSMTSDHFTWRLRDAAVAPLTQAVLEPELITELSGPKHVIREPAHEEEIPLDLINAVVSVEDRRFFNHWGVDPIAISRATMHNLFNRKGLQGGSTITQQLAKNLFLKPKRTLDRKLKEAALALYLNFRFSKKKILTLYLNQIYFGQNGASSIAGVKSAAQFYFGKDLKTLSLDECALLAGIIRSPYRYNPRSFPAAAKSRRDTVLKVMRAEDYISEETYKRTKALPVPFIPPIPAKDESDANYFISEVIRQLTVTFSDDEIFRHGLRIYTTMDPLLQKKAHRSVEGNRTQTALVAIDPDTGHVLALIGGRNFIESQFNRATQAKRQPGSAFKPFVYGAALEQKFTPVSVLADEPRAYSDNNGRVWAPQNFDRVYHSTVTLRLALTLSLNLATLDLAEKLGISEIISFAHRMGIESPLERSWPTVLGAAEVTPLELTAAYAPFVNGGFRVTPTVVTGVLDAEGEMLDIKNSERISVLDPAVASLLTSLLESVVTDGTAKSLKSMDWPYRSAGKTGTTNDGRDAWFVGYTQNLVTGVWVGEDSGKGTGLAGAQHALPVWARFMKDAHSNTPPTDFRPKQGLLTISIDPLSGKRSRSGCPTRKDELFITGTEPKDFCPLHAGGFFGWIKKLFGTESKAP